MRACPTRLVADDSRAVREATEAWAMMPYSAFASHDGPCCMIARRWFRAMDIGLRPAGQVLAGPTWIRVRCTWGPCRWPLYWCQAAQAKQLDCGALAALARYLFAERGVTAYPVQLVQEFSIQACEQWSASWRNSGCNPNWIAGRLAYHEVVGIEIGDEVRIWDPTDNCWLSRSDAGYASTRAVRINAAVHSAFFWQGIPLIGNQWSVLPTSAVPSQLIATGLVGTT